MPEAKLAMEGSPLLGLGVCWAVQHISGLGAPWGTQGVFFAAKLSGSICETQNELLGDGAAWRGSVELGL